MIKENKVAFVCLPHFDHRSRRTIGRTTTGTNISNKHTNVGDVSRSHDETNVININGTNPKSTSILFPSRIFENAKTEVEKKTYRILKISQLINTSKVTSEPLTPKNKKIKLLKFIYAGTFINLQK